VFSIIVEFSMYIKSANVIVITGKYSGELKGNILVDANDTSKDFFINNVVHMNYKNPQTSKDTISLNLRPNGYKAEELVGKCLVIPE